MRILFAGTPEVAVPSLHALVDAGHTVAAVLTRAPAPAGRKHRLVPSPVHQAADALGIPVLTPSTLRDEAMQATLRNLAPEAVAVVAYGLIVPEALLDVPTHGWINLHFSLLPRWRGAAPVQSAIAAGDTTTGAATFRIEKGLDTGPVFATFEEPIASTDTAGSLLEKLSERGAGLLTSTFAALESGESTATPQEGEPSLAPQIHPADARIRWDDPAVVIDRRSRAHTPAPGPWTTLDGQRIKLGPVRAVEQDSMEPSPGVALAPGQVSAGRHVFVGTGDGLVELSTVAPAGKKRMPAADWARGAHLDQESRFDVEEA